MPAAAGSVERLRRTGGRQLDYDAHTVTGGSRDGRGRVRRGWGL